MTISYVVGTGLYINLTNRCPNHCDFCVRDFSESVGDAHSLWLPKEPSLEEILGDLKTRTLSNYSELVFCGFGEPTERLDVMLDVAVFVKKNAPGLPVRVNTNGLADLILGTDTTPRFRDIVDVVSVSLNYARREDYIAHCRPDFPDAFEAMLDFTRRVSQQVPKTVMSVVEGTIPPEDISLCREIAQSCGAELRVRAYIDD